MTPIAATVYINAPLERVWDFVSDIERAANMIEAIKRIELLTPGPVGKGTRFKETRVMFKKDATEEMEITEWAPPRRYVLECDSCGCHYRSAVSCIAEGDGTRVEMSMEAKPLSAVAKIMALLISRMMAGSMRKAFAKDLNDIKRAVEAGVAVSSTAAAT